MESTKEHPATDTLDSPNQSLLSDQDSRPSTSHSTKQDSSTSSSLQTSISERPSTAAASVGIKQVGSDSTETSTQSPNKEQQLKKLRLSGKEPKDLSNVESPLLSKDPFGSEQSKALFDAIDELRICGAGRDLDLPQVSHCGPN